MPVGCEAWVEDLSALIDGELPAEREAEVRAHVDSCESCRARVGALCQVDLALAELSVREPSADLRARLQMRIESTGDERSAPGPAVERVAARRAPPVRGRRFALPALGSALAAAAALALYFALPEPEPPLPTSTPAAPQEPPIEISREVSPPTPAPAPPPDVTPQPEPSTEVAELEAASEEELALAMDFETVEDLDVIANLELLEQLIATEGAG